MSTLIIIFIFLFGLSIGSFLNCLIWRLHKGESVIFRLFKCRLGSIFNNRSHCPKCRKNLSWYDNIPLLSFIVLRGRCRYCKKTISWQYPLVELITATLFTAAYLFNIQSSIDLSPISDFWLFTLRGFSDGGLLTLFRDWFIISIMIIIFIYDLRWYLILDIITLPACLIIFIFNLALGNSWQNLLISGIIGSSFFLFQFVISRGKWIGGGDIRLGLLMGLTLGWPGIITALIIAYVFGSIIGVSLILAGKKKMGSKVPLGVFLSVATIITMYYGDKFWSWYLGLVIF